MTIQCSGIIESSESWRQPCTHVQKFKEIRKMLTLLMTLHWVVKKETKGGLVANMDEGQKKLRQAFARRRDIRDGRGQPALDVGSQLESFSSPPAASWCIFWSQRRFTRGSNWKAEAVWNAAGRPPLGAGNPWFGPLAFRATSSYNWHTACTGSQPLTWENCLALNKQACLARLPSLNRQNTICSPLACF